MTVLAQYSLLLSWLISLFGFLGGIAAGVSGRTRLASSVSNATRLLPVCVGISILVLGRAFAVNDYSLQYVWQFSNRSMPLIYKLSAIWGGMDGSMLLWCFLLSVAGALLAGGERNYAAVLRPWVAAALNSASFFFLTIVVFFTNPFRYIQAPFIPPDGNGLNPLLQNPFMAIHPPMLYLGFTFFTLPFAICMAVLLSGYRGEEWIRTARRWTLLAWGFLTAGIFLGGHWAYAVLGWGGFWAWDPVENASFLPWLTGTAFLHSIMVQERKKMLRAWNVWLIIATYALTVFGTFLTRSGIVQSVHSFAETDVGWVFLIYLALLLAISALFTYLRRDLLVSERKIESYFSREAVFLVNNLLLLSICFATLWGVMFPVLSEALSGEKQTVGIPFFNTVNVPLFLALIFLMGVGPLIAWKQASLRRLVRIFLTPFAIGLAVSVALLWAGVSEFYPLLSYGLSVFVLMTIVSEFHRGIAARRSSGEAGVVQAAGSLFRRHRSRYGGHIVHLGVAVVAVAVTASMAHKTEQEFFLARGESYQLGRFELRLKDLTQAAQANYDTLRAETEVRIIGSGKIAAVLNPEHRFYRRNQEQTNEIALLSSLREDLYLVLAGLDDRGERAAFKVFINPLQIWLWIGGGIMLAGTIVLLIPEKRG